MRRAGAGTVSIPEQLWNRNVEDSVVVGVPGFSTAAGTKMGPGSGSLYKGARRSPRSPRGATISHKTQKTDDLDN